MTSPDNTPQRIAEDLVAQMPDYARDKIHFIAKALAAYGDQKLEEAAQIVLRYPSRDKSLQELLELIAANIRVQMEKDAREEK